MIGRVSFGWAKENGTRVITGPAFGFLCTARRLRASALLGDLQRAQLGIGHVDPALGVGPVVLALGVG